MCCDGLVDFGGCVVKLCSCVHVTLIKKRIKIDQSNKSKKCCYLQTLYYVCVMYTKKKRD